MTHKLPPVKFKSIKLERTGCFGDCPIHKVEIMSDGHVIFHGERFLEEEGIHTWEIDQEAIELLNVSVKKYGFFSMKKKRPTQFMTDMPHCILTIILEDKKRKKINDYLGDDCYPARLRTLERKIDKIIGIQKYTGK
ncbi:MAG: hypothetical protein IPP81_09335 [Chitinophagaceae bacterium]|nr:hypothetical protein [Chitinophagaceae bacterium]